MTGGQIGNLCQAYIALVTRTKLTQKTVETFAGTQSIQLFNLKFAGPGGQISTSF